MPKGRKAEDGRIDDQYQLTELSSASYPARTKRNVRESGGTAIFSLNAELSGGSVLTLNYAKGVKKPVIHLHASNRSELDPVNQLKGFIASNRIEVLNVAGPRERSRAFMSSRLGCCAGIGRNGRGEDPKQPTIASTGH